MSGLQCITAILYFSYNYDHFGFSDRTIITVRPEDKKVDEGTRVDLRCEAKADPSLELRYYWKRDDAVVTYNNKIQWFEGAKVLTIASITVYEAGNYTCVAYTPDPKRSEDQASATIDIKGTNTSCLGYPCCLRFFRMNESGLVMNLFGGVNCKETGYQLSIQRFLR